ncbi:MAG: hypothetical protein JKX69_16010 [Rhodobacteraceae bacterium]|nr:hypothetical protein [Paracoccaceae bacterium]
MRRFALILCLILPANMALAHAGEQGFVLLLPTEVFILAGGLSVALTALLIAVLPQAVLRRAMQPLRLVPWPRLPPRWLVSLAVFAMLCALVAIGFFGPHDPNENALPLAVWALFWFALVVAQGVLGDIWGWLNPWLGPWAVAYKAGQRPIAKYPSWLGHWPALASYLAFATVLLVHPAPADPEQLAAMVALYWALQFLGMLIYGPIWLRRAEGLSVLMRCYSSIAPLRIRPPIFSDSPRRWLWLGFTGWQQLRRAAPPVSLAMFMLALLALGSFDGLNETFWWMGLIGVNPLEFPGRTAVMIPNLLGIAAALAALLSCYAAALMLGLVLTDQRRLFAQAFCALAPALLPIAFGYHFAHYFPSFLVQIQYVTGVIADWTGLEHQPVTSGFFNRLTTVRLIWLVQAGAVVLGHVAAIILSHQLALRLVGGHRRAVISQLPLALFMIGYTVFGLWLLAAPRGA